MSKACLGVPCFKSISLQRVWVYCFMQKNWAGCRKDMRRKGNSMCYKIWVDRWPRNSWWVTGQNSLLTKWRCYISGIKIGTLIHIWQRDTVTPRFAVPHASLQYPTINSLWWRLKLILWSIYWTCAILCFYHWPTLHCLRGLGGRENRQVS